MRKSLFCCILTIYCVALLAHTDPSSEKPDSLMDLPPYLVQGVPDLPEPEKWWYAAFDGFELISNNDRKETDRLIQRFRLYREALELVRPSQASPAVRRAIVLCGNRKSFLQITNRKDMGSPLETCVMHRDHEGCYFVVDNDTRYIRLHGLATQLEDRTWVKEMEVDPVRGLIRQYFLSTQNIDAIAAGLASLIEGLCQLVMDLEVKTDEIRYGRVDNQKNGYVSLDNVDYTVWTNRPVNIAVEFSRLKQLETLSFKSIIKEDTPDVDFAFYVGDRPFHIVLRNAPLLPLKTLFERTSSPYSDSYPTDDTLWQKQSYAFVHLCRFGFNERYRKPLNQLIESLKTQEMSEELFISCFGMGYREMEPILRGYIKGPRAKYDRYKLHESSRIEMDPVELSEASQSDIARIKGSAMRLAGANDKALDTLRVAFDRGERDLALIEALGIAEFEAGRYDRCRALLLYALQNGSKRPLVWASYARLRLHDLESASQADPEALHSIEGEIWALLLHMRQLEPHVPEVYRVANEWRRICSETRKDALETIIREGYSFFPKSLAIDLSIFPPACSYPRL